MRKAVIVLVLCTTALAYEAPKPDKCPVFIASYYDATNRYAPLRVTLINNASQEVRAIKFGVYRHFTTGDNQRTDEVFSDTFNLKPGKKKVFGYQRGLWTTPDSRACILKISFKDGSTWETDKCGE